MKFSISKHFRACFVPGNQSFPRHTWVMSKFLSALHASPGGMILSHVLLLQNLAVCLRAFEVHFSVDNLKGE